MKYKYLGNTGVLISEVVFGTMSFGGEADEEMSTRLFHRCRDAGINCFDCANVYQNGRSEEILGRLIKGLRSEVLLTTKVYFPTSDGVNDRGASRRHVLKAIEDSLRRLATDYVDLYFLHRFDGRTSLEETLRALDDLVTAGKVVYLGVSNFAAWQVQKAIGISALQGLSPVHCIQPMYNLVKRQAEVELFPMAQANNLGVLPYSPLGGGLLTGKYGASERPEQGRLVDNSTYAERYKGERTFEVAGRFAALAREEGVGPAALAVAWAASHPAVTAPILGARDVDQLEGVLAAIQINMTTELRERISALTLAPQPATDRSEEGTEAGLWMR